MKIKDEVYLERLADDLVHIHNDTGIDLAYFGSALDVVSMFYNVEVNVISKKRERTMYTND